ncbi:hypothetical protein [Chryseobacterium tongliaoense]|uniref:hypothetical protein n=1 Tax=Chryseobacterium tongliaoense TaxID=3240933 RepID=UPI003519A647
MKKALTILAFSAVINSYGQVGINTTEPKQELDINGDLLVRNTLRFPDSSNPEMGNGGISGQFLISTGDTTPPKWGTVNIPVVPPGSYYLANAESISDLGTNGDGSNQGVTLSGTFDSGTIPYNEGMDINTTNSGKQIWYPLDGLKTNMIIPGASNDNKVSITLQTIIQFVGNLPAANSYTSFAIGVFIDDKLYAVRLGFFGYDVIDGFQTETVSTTINNLSAGQHTIRVAVARRYNYLGGNLDLYVGKKPPTATNTSNFTNRSSITIQSYVKNTD